MTVSLIGAGPGDIGLLTLRARERLESCDVLIYDRLVPAEILDLAPESARRIYVGKNPDGLTTPQEQINDMLVHHGLQGGRIVRLKGGDPFVFGRGAEEAQALAEAGIDFELVPGISSAFAAPAYAGIPVTHRSISPMVTVVTGHRFVSAPALDWVALGAHGGTLVVLMGVRQLGSIVFGLLEGGMAPDTPVAAVMWATRPGQSVLKWRLGELASSLAESTAPGSVVGVRSPAVIVIGPVVDEATPWFDRRPLFGYRVGLPRPAGGDGQLADELRSLGADVLVSPVTRIEARELPVYDGSADWLVFTSARGVQAFLEAAVFAHGQDTRALAGAQIACIGDKTAGALRSYGLRADLIPPATSGRSLGEALVEVTEPSTVICLPRAERGAPEIVEVLRSAERTVLEVAAYTTVSVPPTDWCATLREPNELDALILTSGSVARSLADGWRLIHGRRPSEVLSPDVRVVALGNSTEQAASSAGFSVDAVAARPDAAALLAALCGDEPGDH